jgi:hypothetical protein
MNTAIANASIIVFAKITSEMTPENLAEKIEELRIAIKESEKKKVGVKKAVAKTLGTLAKELNIEMNGKMLAVQRSISALSGKKGKVIVDMKEEIKVNKKNIENPLSEKEVEDLAKLIQAWFEYRGKSCLSSVVSRRSSVSE